MNDRAALLFVGNASLGLACGPATDNVLVRQLASSERTAPPFSVGVLGCADVLHLTLPATSARVLGLERWAAPTDPLVLGANYSSAVLDAGSGTLTVSGAQGERGTRSQLVVVLPKGAAPVTHLVVNGQRLPSVSTAPFRGLPAVTAQVAWDGVRFGRAQEIRGSSLGGGGGGKWAGSFTVPRALLDQLAARNASYPIVYNTDPQASDDANVPWLAPGRLLVFVKHVVQEPSTPSQTSVGDCLDFVGLFSRVHTPPWGCLAREDEQTKSN